LMINYYLFKDLYQKNLNLNSRIINLFLGFLVMFDLLNVKNISNSPIIYYLIIWPTNEVSTFAHKA